jgi:uncharacterized protein (DUF1330 family)
MPRAYLVANILVHDPEGYDRFRAISGPANATYGGRVLVRNPKPERRVEGIVLLIEFDDTAAARAFDDSPEYTAARAEREEAADTDLMLVEGVQPFRGPLASARTRRPERGRWNRPDCDAQDGFRISSI